MRGVGFVLRALGAGIGVAFIAIGAATFLLPIPVGIVFMTIGAAVLITTSPPFAAWIRARRARHPRVDKLMHRAEKRTPEPARAIARKTDPRRADRGGDERGRVSHPLHAAGGFDAPFGAGRPRGATGRR